ncbi:MAG TPA: TetR/AcrR family transcriptional regulator [Candidatus Dormibacteraeota bacterium]|nr:TetR/AcrR family transcriptional regulator [Candidatus Dormibacteraeota bacterium]
MRAGGGSEVPPVAGSARWWRQRERRLFRRRPRADGLTIERIIEVALGVIDGDGLEALTVRRIASEFETGSASLYRHFSSREELLVLLVDNVIGSVRLPPARLSGRAKVEWLAGELRRVLMSHPHLVPALRASPLLGPNAMRGADSALASLIEAGYEPVVAVRAYLALVDYVLGTVFFDTRTSSRRRGRGTASGERIDALPDEAFPTLRAHQVAFAAPSEEEVFSFGLRAFLDGLERRFLGSSSSTNASSAR